MPFIDLISISISISISPKKGKFFLGFHRQMWRESPLSFRSFGTREKAGKSRKMAGKPKDQQMLPLGVLLKQELSTERTTERPEILHGQANQSKKGEDFTFSKTECQRVPGDGSTTFAVFAVDYPFPLLGSWCDACFQLNFDFFFIGSFTLWCNFRLRFLIMTRNLFGHVYLILLLLLLKNFILNF